MPNPDFDKIDAQEGDTTESKEQWMSYMEISNRTGLTKAQIKGRVRRHGLKSKTVKRKKYFFCDPETLSTTRLESELQRGLKQQADEDPRQGILPPRATVFNRIRCLIARFLSALTKAEAVAILAVLSVAVGVAGLGLTIKYSRSPSPPPLNPQSDDSISSLAVLSFATSKSESEGNEIAQRLKNSLSKLRGLTVDPGSRGREENADPLIIGRELHVKAVLSGTYTLSGEEVSISARLLDMQRGEPIWTYQDHRTPQELSAMLAEIIRGVSKTLGKPIEEPKPENETTNSKAVGLYKEGLVFWNQRTKYGMNRARDNFLQAIALDPKFALAHVGLADSYNLLARYGFLSPNAAFPEAKEAAQAALAIDPLIAEAHASLAYASFSYDWKWFVAEREFRLAIDLDQNCANAHHWYGLYWAAMGELDKAIQEIELAKHLNPSLFIASSNLGRVFYYKRQFNQAVEQYQETLRLEGGFAEAHLRLGQAYQEIGDYENAVKELESAIQLSEDDSTAKGVLGYVYARASHRSDAQKQLDELKSLQRSKYVSSYNLALVYIGLGEKEKALDSLERAYNERYSLLVYIRVDPELDSLRDDKRFKDLLRRVFGSA